MVKEHVMTSTDGASFQVHSEAHGPHWVAWVTRGDSDQPDHSVVLVARTKEEAETRAREWAEKN